MAALSYLRSGQCLFGDVHDATGNADPPARQKEREFVRKVVAVVVQQVVCTSCTMGERLHWSSNTQS